MEALIALLFIIIILLIIKQNNKLFQQLQKIEKELNLLKNNFSNFCTSHEKKDADPIVSETKSSSLEPYKSIFTLNEDIPVNQISKENNLEPEVVTEVNIPANNLADSYNNNSNAAPKIPSIKKPTFFEKHPDMEKFIGENLVNKIGIAILVLAIGFFVKYAIDQNWVGPIGRVSIGILCGAVLIGIAHKMRNNYKSFSSVLAGGGLAVFYFTITLAYHQFHLFEQTAAFVIMIVITVFAVLLSILYNKQELAVIALLGGFVAPFLVSNGSGNYKSLFIYLIILNIGLLAIAYNKAWRLLNFLSFVFTIILFGGWLISLDYNETFSTYKNAFIFATIFYLLFFAINVAHNIKEKNKFIASDFGILLANTALYFGVGIYFLHKINAEEYKGLFSASMGIFNLITTYFLFRKQKVDTNILFLLMGITLTFVSITAPLQLSGHNITMFWASEAVLLYWLYMQSSIRIIQYSSVIIWALMIISLFMDWNNVYAYYTSPLKIIANKGFITTIFSAIATYALFLLRKREVINLSTLNMMPGKLFFRIAAIVLLFIAGLLEINFQFKYYYPETQINLLYLLLYTFSFSLIFITITNKNNVLNVKEALKASIFIGCIILYLCSIINTYGTQSNMLVQNKNHVHFISHWLVAILFVMIFYKLVLIIKGSSTLKKYSVIAWLLCSILVIFFSVEISLITYNIFFSAKNDLYEIQRVYSKTGLPILWGLCSFAFMWLGMRYKYRPLRIISLTLFTLTLLKLFIFDIKNIPAGGKIAAFFCLGIILLVVSFMYQRLKKIIVEDEQKSD